MQQQKREKAQAKQERKAARRLEGNEVDVTAVHATEAELVDELAALHAGVEAATISPEDFERGRERIRVQLEQLAQLEAGRS